MAHLNRMGPEEEGSKTGRGLGLCKSNNINEFELGHGLAKRRKAINKTGKGYGKRLRSSKFLLNNN